MSRAMKPGTYRVGVEAVAICTKYGLAPKDLIPVLEREVSQQRARAERAEGLKEMIRGIVLVEGVNLSQGTKEFFRDLFEAVLNEMASQKAMIMAKEELKEK